MKLIYCSCIFLQYGGFYTFDPELMYYLWDGKKIGNVEKLAKKTLETKYWKKYDQK